MSAFQYAPATGGEGGEGYDIGSEVANVKLKNVDGKIVSFADFKDEKRTHRHLYLQYLSLCCCLRAADYGSGQKIQQSGISGYRH